MPLVQRPATPSSMPERQRLQSSASSRSSQPPPELTLPPPVHQPTNAPIQRSVSYEISPVLPSTRSPSRKLPSQPPMARLSPPRPDDSRNVVPSGTEFEDEVARQAEVMRQERLSRRITQAQESGARPGSSRGNEAATSIASVSADHTRDKGKRRASGIGPETNPAVLVGNLISEGHVNYVLMYNMLTGIRIGVSSPIWLSSLSCAQQLTHGLIRFLAVRPNSNGPLQKKTILHVTNSPLTCVYFLSMFCKTSRTLMP